MDISIGTGPDYILTRGLELLNYRFEFELHVGGKCIKRKSFVHRSLAMVTKDCGQFLNSHSDYRTWQSWEIDFHVRCLKAESPNLGLAGIISIKGPNGLLDFQFDEIADIFVNNLSKIIY